MKNALKTALTVVILLLVALLFGLMASRAGYQITLYNFIAGNGTHLAPDFSYNIKTQHQVLAVLYIIAYLALAFFSGRRSMKNIFRGMMIYSALPFVGLIGWFFLRKSMKAGILMILTLVWGYPYFPLIITESRVSAIVTPIGILMFLVPALSYAAYIIGKKTA